MSHQLEIALNLVTQLRKEIVQTQRNRLITVCLKISLVTLSSLFILTSQGLEGASLFLVPAFIASLFDFVISSHSFSIKRAGSYIRKHLEPLLRASGGWPSDTPLWEEFVSHNDNRQHPAIWGNFSLSFITALVAIMGWVGSLGEHAGFGQIIYLAAGITFIATFTLSTKNLFSHRQYD